MQTKLARNDVGFLNSQQQQPDGLARCIRCDDARARIRTAEAVAFAALFVNLALSSSFRSCCWAASDDAGIRRLRRAAFAFVAAAVVVGTTWAEDATSFGFEDRVSRADAGADAAIVGASHISKVRFAVLGANVVNRTITIGVEARLVSANPGRANV
jgi:hypothetical protein